MIDYFALLQQPRRPWLEAEQLKENYHRLTISQHPDRHSPHDKSADLVTDFASVNEAYRVLLDPNLRLQHLLKLERIPASDVVPTELSDVFLETGTLIQEIDRLPARSTTSSLSKAVAQSELLEKRKLTDDLLEKLQTMYKASLEELQKVDRVWISTREIAPELSSLSSKLAYLSRWITQLEERQFQLSI